MTDRIPKEEFLHLAKDLPLGESKRVDHICGPGRTMIISNKDEGVSAFCFRCNASGWHAHAKPSLAERLEKRREAKSWEDHCRDRPLQLPSGGSYDTADWPQYAKVWLYKAGLSNEAILRTGIYYHPGMDRVVLPVLDWEKVLYWQARGFDKDRPKYLNPKVDDKPVALFKGISTEIVVTEDLLSAIRVNGAGFSSACILGTNLSDSQATSLKKWGGAYVWLDPDDAGRKASRKITHQLEMMGFWVEEVKTRKDPKYYSDQEIREILK